MAISKDTYLPWFILKEIPGLGPHHTKSLIRFFNSPEQALDASKSELKSAGLTSDRLIRNILNHDQYADRAWQELNICRQHGFKIIHINHPDYPELLREVSDPPPFFTMMGTIDAKAPCISIVGSRKATSYGLSSARKLAYDLAQKGFTIVSGLARGIDTAAHEGALEAGGQTIAVLGSGLNHIYPVENILLSRRIRESGAVISEFYANLPPKPAHFPIRNRIIAGISTGTVVVEAAKRSGSLITARLSGEYGREVFAVPGSIKSTTSEGTHLILKQGATLVENHMDIIDEIGQFIHLETQSNDTVSPPGMSKTQLQGIDDTYTRSILKILDPYPIHIDQIIKQSGLDAGGITAALLELELNGVVSRSQGNFYNISEENLG